MTSIRNVQVQRVNASSQTLPAITAIIGAGLSVSLLIVLHLIRRDVDPSWTVISAYALGERWWLMTTAFAAMAIGCAALCVQLVVHVKSASGWAGWVLLAVSAAGFALAAGFPTDPITAAASAVTRAGQVHALGAALGGMIPPAALLLSWHLSRQRAWAPSRPWLWGATALVWLGEAVFVGAMISLLPRDGTLGPDVHIGWQNRFMMATYCSWVIVLGWQARLVDRRPVSDTPRRVGRFP